MTIFYIIGGVLLLVILLVVGLYNGLVSLNVRCNEAASDIDVQTKRRYDLIPNLIETVKGYMSHEREVFENVTKTRTEAMSASGDPIEKAEKENALSGTLKTLFAVSENYPDLKANANFLDLQRELADTENKIQASRRFFNANVRDLNIKIESFPTNFIAGMLGFSKMDFFAVTSEAEKEPVKVNF